VKKLEQYESLLSKLKAAEQTSKSLELKLDEAQRKWVRARSNEETAIAAMDEQQSKYEKRWTELSEALSASMAGTVELEDEGDDGDNAVSTGEGRQGSKDDGISGGEEKKAPSPVARLLESQAVEQSKMVAKLQHKLAQALENVRQAESTRSQLKDALTMNESLHSKLEELKTKYAAARSSVVAANAAAAPAGSEAVPPSSSAKPQSSSDLTDLAASSSTSSLQNDPSSSSTGAASTEKLEKLHRDNRRMRKEISAVMASKEAAKAKLERAEKERDSLVESNARLLKQITEKDDMNAKSLSTILHLKSMTEQLTLERDNLEQQVKSASQLSLAARLATNAKERLSEEVNNEKEALQRQVKELESKCESTKSQLDRITVEYSQASSKTATLNGELTNALKRIEGLAAELEEKNVEIRSLKEQVSAAERQAEEATENLKKVAQSAESGGGVSVSASGSLFTVDQLNTQIAVLKNRLACPVCHYRDKECIIMRCRHMHCKQCVEERITNRSRKCPTCNNRFSEKDVEDIWLN